MSSKKSPQTSTDEKRHKKVHKHKKHKRHDSEIESYDNLQVSSTSQTPLKLTLKIGGQTLAEKSVVKSTICSADNQSVEVYPNEEEFDTLDFEEENYEELNDNEEADEEEIWLDALEEGRLHEVDDELKKIKDPKLMTARQRALLENKSIKKKDEDTMSLMVAQNQASNALSEEMIERKLIKDRKRRQMAEEKKEKDKRQTIERLLRKKQEAAKAKKKKKHETPKMTYINNQKGVFLCLPNAMPFELLPSDASSPPERHASAAVKCGRDGCGNTKKYSCSKTNIPLCSFECYKEVNKQLISVT